MPKLLLFIPCDKLIIDQDTKLLSLIEVMEQVTVYQDRDSESLDAQDSLVSWNLVTLWSRMPEDQGKSYEQEIEVVFPDGQTSSMGTVPFELVKQTHRNIVKVNNFSVKQIGNYTLRSRIKEQGNDSDWQPAGEYAFTVELRPGEV